MQSTIYLDGADPESGDGMDSLLSPSSVMEMDGIDNSRDELDDGRRDSDMLAHSHEEDSDTEESGDGARKKRHKGVGLGAGAVDGKVKIALSLYKVQQNIYLLDFQRVEVSQRCVCLNVADAVRRRATPSAS